MEFSKPNSMSYSLVSLVLKVTPVLKYVPQTCQLRFVSVQLNAKISSTNQPVKLRKSSLLSRNATTSMMKITKLNSQLSPYLSKRNFQHLQTLKPLSTSFLTVLQSVLLLTTLWVLLCAVVEPPVARLSSLVRSVVNVPRPRSTTPVTRFLLVNPRKTSLMLLFVTLNSVKVFLVLRSRLCKVLKSVLVPQRKSCPTSSKSSSLRTKRQTSYQVLSPTFKNRRLSNELWLSPQRSYDYVVAIKKSVVG